MAKQDINIGSGVNKGDGDILREALRKANENFTEIYDTLDIASGTGSFLGLSDTPSTYPAVLVDPVTQQPLVTKQILTLNDDGDGIKFTSEISPDQITGIHPVATSGDYNDLSNTPTLHPVAVNGQYSALSGQPALTTVALTGSYNDLQDRPNLAQVAVSGQYQDLLNKPSIPASLLDLISDGQTGQVLSTDGNGNFSWVTTGSSIDWQNVINTPTTISGFGITDAFDGDYNSLANKPTLFDGDYNSLTNKPTLFNGDFDSLSNNLFTANRDPILGTDVNFVGDNFDFGNGTGVDLQSCTVLFTGATVQGLDYTSISNTPTIPTAVSQLSNDSNFISGISSSDVTTALGFTPYNATNPDGFISGITSSDISTALGFTPSNFDGDYNNLVNKPTTYDELLDLADVDDSSLAVGNVLVYRNVSGSNVWKTEPLDMQDIANVDTSGVSNGNILSYDGFGNQWTIGDIVKLPILTAEPSSPENGMIAIADGTNWDPMSNAVQTMVVYLAGAWRQIAQGNV